jgi:hypothetical protein
MFKKYRYKNKAKEIEAVQFTDLNKNRVFNSLTGQYAPSKEEGKPVIKVTTIHGDIVVARFGDWIVKEPELGFYYIISQEAFNTACEQVTVK